MVRAALRQSWLENFHREVESASGVPAVIADLRGRSPRSAVELTRMPGTEAASLFEYVISIGCIEPEHPFVADIVRWLIEFCDLALVEDFRWDQQFGGSESQRALLIGILALANAIHANSAVDAGLLGEVRAAAILDLEETTGDDWGDVSQSYYLRSVQFCLLGGGHEEALRMLNCGRDFDWTQRWYDWLLGLGQHMQSSSRGVIEDGRTIERFDQLFDRARAPRANFGDAKGEVIMVLPRLFALQLACIRWIWIDGQKVEGAWPDILASISNP